MPFTAGFPALPLSPLAREQRPCYCANGGVRDILIFLFVAQECSQTVGASPTLPLAQSVGGREKRRLSGEAGWRLSDEALHHRTALSGGDTGGGIKKTGRRAAPFGYWMSGCGETVRFRPSADVWVRLFYDNHCLAVDDVESAFEGVDIGSIVGFEY